VDGDVFSGVAVAVEPDCGGGICLSLFLSFSGFFMLVILHFCSSPFSLVNCFGCES
jgi:hypothetical protein